jgi:hypothetical protein
MQPQHVRHDLVCHLLDQLRDLYIYICAHVNGRIG